MTRARVFEAKLHQRDILTESQREKTSTPMVKEDDVIDLTRECDADAPPLKRQRSVCGEEPHGLQCQISHMMFRDPVIVCASGHTYERYAIQKWFEKKDTDPVTREKVTDKAVMTNWAVRHCVEEWLEDNPGRVPDGWDSRRLLPPNRGRLSAELRRVCMNVPTTATLPERIALPSGECVDDVLTLGRECCNDVRLECPRVPSLVSRRHAEIYVDKDGTHFVMDKHTKNGTYVNNEMIQPGPLYQLNPGDVVSFGGPNKVLRNNEVLRNSFRYEYKVP